MYAFCNEKTIENKTYTAFRDTENPEDVKIVIDGVEEIFPANFKEYWRNL